MPAFHQYFDFYNLSPYNRCENNICINEVFPSGSGGASYEASPEIYNIYSSNLNRDHYGENNFVSYNDARVKVLSGFDLSNDFTLAIHAFISGNDVTVFENGGVFRVTNNRFYSKYFGTSYSREIPNYSQSEVDVLIRRKDDSYRVYGLLSGINYIDFTPLSIDSPANNNTYLLPFVSGNFCELLYSPSGWSDSDLDLYFRSKYTLETHLTENTGYIVSEIPQSSGYNEIPLSVIPNFTIKDRDPFFYELNQPIFIDYNSINNNSGYYIDIETSSDFDFTYSGELRYGNNGRAYFMGNISSGNNIDTFIPVYNANNQPLTTNDATDFTYDSKLLLNGSYSGYVKVHNLDVVLDSYESILSLNKNLNLFLGTREFEDRVINFFTAGHIEMSSGLDLYASGATVADNSVDLFIKRNLRVDESLDFYLNNVFVSVNTTPFFMSGRDLQEESSFDMYTYGAFVNDNQLDMFISGVGSEQTSINLFTYNSLYGNNISQSGNIPEPNSGILNKSLGFHIPSVDYNNSINFYINATASSGTPINFYTVSAYKYQDKHIDFALQNSRSGVDNTVNFVALSSSKENESLNMFIAREYEGVDEFVDMFIKTSSGTNSTVNFVTDGTFKEYNSIEMSLSGTGTKNNNINLMTHGF